MKVEVILYNGEVYEIKGVEEVDSFLDSVCDDNARFVKVGYKTYEDTRLSQGFHPKGVAKYLGTVSVEKYVDVAFIKEFNLHEKLGGYVEV